MMTDFPTFLAHTKVTRIETPASKHRVCPFCSSTDLKMSGYRTTTMGGGDGTKDGDPNHQQQNCRCRACDHRFERHWKRGNVWYVDPKTHVLLAGVAACFEEFNYPCTCGGVIYRSFTDLDGASPAKVLSFKVGMGRSSYSYRTFWTCDTCALRVETEFDDAGNVR